MANGAPAVKKKTTTTRPKAKARSTGGTRNSGGSSTRPRPLRTAGSNGNQRPSTANRNGSAPARSRSNSPTSNNRNTGPQDRIEIQSRRNESTTRNEQTVSNISNLTRGIEENFSVGQSNTQTPQQQSSASEGQPTDPRSNFFKDPQRGQKLDQARTDLTAAQEGNHQDLEQIREQQQGNRDKTLAPQRENAEQAQQQLQRAEQNLQQAQETNRQAEANQASDNERAREEKRDARRTLDDVRKPGESSAASLVDTMDRAQDYIDSTTARNDANQREHKAQAEQQSNTIQDRYGDQLNSNPELKQNYDRYMSIDGETRGLDSKLDSVDEKLKNPDLKNWEKDVLQREKSDLESEKSKLSQEKRELGKEMRGVTDGDGNNLGSDAYKLDSTLTKAKTQQASTDRTVKMYERQKEEAQKKGNSLYGNEPGIGDKIKNYRGAKNRYESTKPEAVAKANEQRLDKAQGQLLEAKDNKTKADTNLDSKTREYDSTQGAADKQEIADKQKQLVDSLEDQVKDLSTIKSTDLSDSIRNAPGLGYGIQDIKLDGDKLTFSRDGMNYTATGNDEGGVQLEGRSSQEGNKSSNSVTRSPKEDGGWQTDRIKETKDTDFSLSTRDYTRFADGSSKDVRRSDSKKSDKYSHSETVKGADGSSVSRGERRGNYDTTNWESKSSAPRAEFGGKQDTQNRSRSVSHDGGRITEGSTVRNADGSSVSNNETYSRYDYTKKTNVEGASWLWKDSPQNLRNAIGSDAEYGKVSRSSTVTSADGKETTSKSESERWTSADGNRTLEAQRGQKGLPDTWNYTTKKGDEVQSQTFIRGSEDTSTRHEYTDRDGFRVTESEEDFTETAGQIKEHTGKDTPATGHTVSRTKSDASMGDLERLAKENPELAEFMKSSDFQRLRDALGDDKFELAIRESEQTLTNGVEQGDFQLNMMGPDGHNLVIMSDGESGGMRLTEPGQDGYRGVTLLDADGNRMEMGSDGKMAAFDAKGTKKFAKDIKKFTDAPGKIPHGIRGMARELPHDLSKLRMFKRLGLFQGSKMAPEMGEFLKTMKKYDSAHSASFGRAVDMLGAGLSAYDTFNKASDGDWGGAAKSVASGFRDIGGLSKATGQGFRAGTYLDDAGQVVKPWASGAKLSSVSRVGQMGKALGAAGALFQAGEGVYDMTQGEYMRGGLNMAAAGGTALAIWGGASWAGPVGWGVAALATAGVYTIDYVNSNAIAEPMIPLY